MESETTNASSRPVDRQRVTVADALASNGELPLQIRGEDAHGRKCGYSMIVRGEIQASSILSSTEPEETVTLLEDDTKLVSGSVRGDTAGFVLDGTILAVEFDDPEPVVTVDGAIVDPSQWPTVKEFTGYGPGQERVEDPFPECGELGKPPGDPLDPEEYVIGLDAAEMDESNAYCIDIDGTVVSHPDSATVSDAGDRVYGYLCPDWSAEIQIRGVITRIDTADGISHSIRACD